jgi:hypothetical protein
MLLSTFTNRWNGKTFSLHLLISETTVTLDYVSCLLHIPVRDCLLDHDGLVSRHETIYLSVELIGTDLVTTTNGAHSGLNLLRT